MPPKVQVSQDAELTQACGDWEQLQSWNALAGSAALLVTTTAQRLTCSAKPSIVGPNSPVGETGELRDLIHILGLC